jgi:hypothetical protein
MNKNKWASVMMVDGMVFEGMIAEETSWGLYLHIGGNSDRLSLFPWHAIGRVVYKLDL